MEHYELPLVFFTVLSQASVGMTLLLSGQIATGKVESKRWHWLANGVLLAVASVAALLHLAHPLQAANALLNLQYAWLSREILSATLYGAAVGVAFLCNGKKLALIAASLFGVVLVAVQGMTYAAPAMVAIANGLTMLLFFLTVWVMGAAAVPLLSGQATSAALLRQGLLLSMLLLLAAPVSWMSGGTVVRLTAWQWLSSPLYLAAMISLALSLMLSLLRPTQVIAPLLLALLGMLLSRMVFFGDTVSASINMGHLY